MAVLSHRLGRAFVVVAFLFSSVVLVRSTDEAPASAYRVGVSEVRVSFFVTNEKNRLVSQVGNDDFAVVDNGDVVRRFTSLSRSHDTALDVVVLVDSSQSAAPGFRFTVGEVLKIISQSATAGDDRISGNQISNKQISVISFSGLQPVLVCSGDCRNETARQKLVAVSPAGQTPLFDALAYSAGFLASRVTPNVLPVLVLFSDGNDTISRTSAPDALRSIIANGVVVYAVDNNESRIVSRGSLALRRMAEATGGRYFSSEEAGTSVLEAALADLRASYIVTYHVPDQIVGFHSLRILPKHDLNLRFHCRSGYSYEKLP